MLRSCHLLKCRFSFTTQMAAAASCQPGLAPNGIHQASGLAKHKQGVVVCKINNKRSLFVVAFVIVVLQSVSVRCDNRNITSATSITAAATHIAPLRDSGAARGQKLDKNLADVIEDLSSTVTSQLTGNGTSSSFSPLAITHFNTTIPIEAPPSYGGHQPLADMGMPAAANALPHPVATRRSQIDRTTSATPPVVAVTSPRTIKTSSTTTQPQPQSRQKKTNSTQTGSGKPTEKSFVHHLTIVNANRTAKSSTDRESNFTTQPSSSSNGSSVSIPEMTSSDNRTMYDPLYEMSMNAWSWHFYVFGIAFCLLGILSTYSLLHFVFCLNVLQRLYFFLSNVCLCLFCLLRCCYIMRADSYRATSLPYAVAMYDSSTLLITLAVMLLFGGACTFSEVQWWLFRPIRATVVNVFVVPYGVITTSLLTAIVLVGGAWWFDDVATFYLLLVLKSVSALWSVAFVVLSWLLYGRLYKDSLRKQSQILRTELTKLHIEGTQLPRNIPKPCLCLCVRSLFVTACLLLIFNALLIYGLVYSQDMTLSLLVGRIGSPHWWIYQNVTCVFEVGMCACLACGHCWSHCGHQCRSLLGKRIADWDFRRDVWQTSARRLRRLSERRFRRRPRGGAGGDGRCRSGGVEAGDDYDVIERLAVGNNTEFPASCFGIYGNGGSGMSGGRGVSSSTHFTFERWERSYKNGNGNRAVATDTASDLSNPTLSGNELATRHPQHSHHYFHTATVRPVLKTFQRLSQVSPQRLQAQLRSSTLALQRKGRHVSSAVVSSLRSLTTSRRSSSSSCSSGNVASTSGQLGLSVVTPVRFSTSPRFCGVVSGRKADYVNVPTETTMTINCGGGQKHSSYQKHGRQNNLLNVQENDVTCESPHVILRKRYLNKRMLEKSCKRKTRHSNKASCCGGQDDTSRTAIGSITATSISRQQHYTSPAVVAAATSSSVDSCKKTAEKRKMMQRGGKKGKGKVKEFANKVLMVSRATQVYIPSPHKGGGRSCFLPEPESMTGSRYGADRGDVEVEEENGDEEFEYDDDQDLISAANKYMRADLNHPSHPTSSPSPYHHQGTLIKRSWHHTGNSSTSCSSESAANSFDVRFYVYSPSPGDASPMSSPSRDFHDHFYPKLYQHNHHRRHQRNHHTGKERNCRRHGSSDCAAATTNEVLPVQCTRKQFVDPYSTVDRSGTDDVIGGPKFLPRLTSASMLEFGPAKPPTVVSHHCRTVSDVGTGSHYAATQLVPPRDSLVVTVGSSASGSTGSSRPPSNASGQSEKQNVMYLSEDDDGRLGDGVEEESCCSLATRHQLHPNNLNLSLPLERDVYYPTVVCIKSRNPQDITPDSAVYLELNSPQTVDTPPTIREHPRRFPPFPSSSAPSKNVPRPLAANPSPLRKSASFGNLSQLNQNQQNHRHYRESDQKKQHVLHMQSGEKSMKSTAFSRGSHSMEQLSCRLCSDDSATDVNCRQMKNELSEHVDGRQVRWRRWSSANELDPSSTSNSDSVYDSKDSVSFPSHDADETEIVVTSGQQTFSACDSTQRSSVQCHVKTARTSNCV